MRTLDFSPLYRSTVGFDRLFDLLDSASQLDQNTQGYPPYNIEVTREDAYRITLAVAGFSEDELSVEYKENQLTVSGKHAEEKTERKYLHHGIAGRGFERRFHLADHVRVTGADLVNGLLHIDLVREIPETKKPRRIAISNGNQQIEGSAPEAA